MYEHLEPLTKKLLSLKIEKPPPWELHTVISVDGLCSVGFDRDTENLLILSHQGRGVVDCFTGEKPRETMKIIMRINIRKLKVLAV